MRTVSQSVTSSAHAAIDAAGRVCIQLVPDDDRHLTAHMRLAPETTLEQANVRAAEINARGSIHCFGEKTISESELQAHLSAGWEA